MMIPLLVLAVLLPLCLSFQPQRLGVNRLVLSSENRVNHLLAKTNNQKSMQLYALKKENEKDDYFESEVNHLYFICSFNSIFTNNCWCFVYK